MQLKTAEYPVVIVVYGLVPNYLQECVHWNQSNQFDLITMFSIDSDRLNSVVWTVTCFPFVICLYRKYEVNMKYKVQN